MSMNIEQVKILSNKARHTINRCSTSVNSDDIHKGVIWLYDEWN